MNRGILRAYSDGIVTSTSIMVYGVGIVEGVDDMKSLPELSKGLHFTFNDRALDEKIRRAEQISSREIKIVTEQLKEQIYQFELLFGELPDHLDSHHSAHSHGQLVDLFKKISRQISIPLRGFNGVRLITDFYKKVDTNSLIEIIKRLPNGVNELICHPGMVDNHLLRNSRYVFEREEELKTLTSREVINFIRNSGIELCTWSNFKHLI